MVLCALTGLGNGVLRTLLSMNIRPELLITRREPENYPYYGELDLIGLAGKLDIPVSTSLDALGAYEPESLDLILSATFHRRLEQEHRSKARLCVNVHPSLLPELRGRNPFYWAIRQGKNTTGITIHTIEDDFDTGPVWLQEEVPIQTDETQGSLRLKLADVACRSVYRFVHEFHKSQQQNIGYVGPDTPVLGAPKPEDLDLALAEDKVDLDRRYRAAMPYPGATYDGHPIKSLNEIENSFG